MLYRSFFVINQISATAQTRMPGQTEADRLSGNKSCRAVGRRRETVMHKMISSFIGTLAQLVTDQGKPRHGGRKVLTLIERTRPTQSHSDGKPVTETVKLVLTLDGGRVRPSVSRRFSSQESGVDLGESTLWKFFEPSEVAKELLERLNRLRGVHQTAADDCNKKIGVLEHLLG